MSELESFQDRIEMTQELEGELCLFLESHGFLLEEFGYEKRFSEKSRKVLSQDSYKNENDAAMMVRYAPDYFLVHPQVEPTRGCCFLDVKVSITPIYLESEVNVVRQKANKPSLTRHDIGEVEREAIDVYNQYFPQGSVCLVMGCVYNPDLVVAEWTSDITELRRLEVDRNIRSSGSRTPHVNIHLGKMRTLENFITTEFGIAVDSERYKRLLTKIQEQPLRKPCWLYQETYDRVRRELSKQCPWLERPE